MASVAGLRATPYNAAYCASKGGVIMLTKSMAIELAKAGVRVNAVCPASVDTPFLRNFEIPEGADLSLFARAASPMGRLIDPAEVAAAVAYLASDDAGHRQRHHPGHRRGRYRLTIGQRHRVGVPSRAQHPARSLAGHLAVDHHLAPADEDVVDAPRAGNQALAPTGQVVEDRGRQRSPPWRGRRPPGRRASPSAIRPRWRSP